MTCGGLHPEPSSQSLYTQLVEITHALAEAQRQHRESDAVVEAAKAKRLELADRCIALGSERKRLMEALGDALTREAGLGVAEPVGGVSEP